MHLTSRVFFQEQTEEMKFDGAGDVAWVNVSVNCLLIN